MTSYKKDIYINVDQLLNDDVIMHHDVNGDLQKCNLLKTNFSSNAITCPASRNDGATKVIMVEEHLFHIKLESANLSLKITVYNFGVLHNNTDIVVSQNISLSTHYTTMTKLMAYNNVLIILTDIDLIFIDISDKSNPIKLGEYTLINTPVVQMTIHDTHILHILSEKLIEIYDLRDISKMSFKNLDEMKKLTQTNGALLKLGNLQDIAFCGNVSFLAFNKTVTVYQFDIMKLNQEYNPQILKQLTFSNKVLRVVTTGRSLIVLTSDFLFEYIFRLDCLDVQLLRNFTLSDFGIKAPDEFWNNYMDIYVASESGYYLFQNKVSNNVFVIKSSQFTKKKEDIFIYQYTSSYNLFDLTFSEFFYNYNQNGLLLGTLGYRDLQKVVLMKIPAQVHCTGSLFTSAIVNLNSTGIFCSDIMYNFTEEVQKLAKANNTPGEYIYDPLETCSKQSHIRVNFTLTPQVKVLIASFSCSFGLVLLFFLNYLVFRCCFPEINNPFLESYREHKNEHDTDQEGNGITPTEALEKGALQANIGTKRSEFNEISFGVAKENGGGESKDLENSVAIQGYDKNNTSMSTIQSSKRKFFTKKKKLQIEIPHIETPKKR
jgi:hypothetical protein